jgi:hypothetical protein
MMFFRDTTADMVQPVYDWQPKGGLALLVSLRSPELEGWVMDFELLS